MQLLHSPGELVVPVFEVWNGPSWKKQHPKEDIWIKVTLKRNGEKNKAAKRKADGVGKGLPVLSLRFIWLLFSSPFS